MQDRVPEARLYKVWLAPNGSATKRRYLQLADCGAHDAARRRDSIKRLVYEDQIATDAGAFALIGEIAGAYIVYATAGGAKDIREASSARSTRSSRASSRDGPTRAELERVRDRDRSGVHPRHRAGRRLPRQVEHPRGEHGVRRPAGFLQAFARRLERRHAAAGARDGARKWIDGRAARLEVHPFPTELAPSGGGARPLEAADAARRFRRAPFPALQQARLENGMRLIVAERHAVPGSAVQLAARRRLRGRPIRVARRRERCDGDAGRRHGDDGRARDQRHARRPRRGSHDRREPRLSRSSSLSALKENLDASLAVYADVILNPAFAPAELERLKRLQIAGIQQEKNDPTDMALRCCRACSTAKATPTRLPMTGSGTEEAVASA